MSQEIYKTKRGNEIPIRADGFNFKSYMKNTYQHFYYSKIFDDLYKEYKDCSETKWQKYIDSLAFFVTVITAVNETDFRQAGKYPPPTMLIQNARQLTGEKILKYPKRQPPPKGGKLPSVTIP